MLSYRSNPHCGGQGVYVKNLSRALRDLGHAVTVVAGPPDPGLDEGIRHIPLHGLNLYDPADPFRMPTLRELADPVNLMEWVGVYHGLSRTLHVRPACAPVPEASGGGL